MFYFYDWSSHGAIFAVYLHTSILFELRRTSVSVEIYQISSQVFICTFNPKISSFFEKSFPFFFAVFVKRYTWNIWKRSCQWHCHLCMWRQENWSLNCHVYCSVLLLTAIRPHWASVLKPTLSDISATLRRRVPAESTFAPWCVMSIVFSTATLLFVIINTLCDFPVFAHRVVMLFTFLDMPCIARE